MINDLQRINTYLFACVLLVFLIVISDLATWGMLPVEDRENKREVQEVVNVKFAGAMDESLS